MKYTTTSDNYEANKEIERWQMKKFGVNPIKHYISNVIYEILKKLPKNSDVDYYIIEDVITQKPDDFMQKNVYDFYKELIDEKIAAEFFKKILKEYMLG